MSTFLIEGRNRSPGRVGRPPGRGLEDCLVVIRQRSKGHRAEGNGALGSGRCRVRGGRRQPGYKGGWESDHKRHLAPGLFSPSASLMFNLSSRSHSQKVSGPWRAGVWGCVVTHQEHHSWFRGKKSNLETEERAGFRGIDPTFLSIRAYLLLLPPRRPSCS